MPDSNATIDNSSDNLPFWDETNSLFAAFHVSRIFSIISNIGNLTLDELKETWKFDDSNPWLNAVTFFIPKIIYSGFVIAISAAATAIAATVGSITSGIIGGTFQALFGLLQVTKGIITGNFDSCKKGIKNILIGPTKLLLGSAIAGSIALAIMTGVGAPAVAGIAPVVSFVGAGGILPIITPIVTAGHAALIGLGTTIASTPLLIAATVGIGVLATCAISGISMVFGKIKSKKSRAPVPAPAAPVPDPTAPAPVPDVTDPTAPAPVPDPAAPAPAAPVPDPTAPVPDPTAPLKKTIKPR